MIHLKLDKVFCLLALATILFSCGSNYNYNYEIKKNENGLTITQDSLLINIEVVNESIIHVNKMKVGSSASNIPDYVTILEPQATSWELEETVDEITISTKKIKVLVNSDGTIEYKTKYNKNLLSETNEHTFIKSNNEGDYTVSQAFIAGDEALYGLGQFQSGIMD